jgi:hypothetical protein
MHWDDFIAWVDGRRYTLLLSEEGEAVQETGHGDNQAVLETATARRQHERISIIEQPS